MRTVTGIICQMSWVNIDENALAADIIEGAYSDESSDELCSVQVTTDDCGLSDNPLAPEGTASIVLLPKKYFSPLHAFAMLLYSGIGAASLSAPLMIYRYGISSSLLIFALAGLGTMFAQLTIVRLSIHGTDTLPSLKTSTISKSLMICYQLVVASTSLQIIYLFFSSIIKSYVPSLDLYSAREAGGILSFLTISMLILVIPKSKLKYLQKKMGIFTLVCVLTTFLLLCFHLISSSPDTMCASVRWDAVPTILNIPKLAFGVGFCLHSMTNYMSLSKLVSRVHVPQQLYFIIPLVTLTVVAFYFAISVMGLLIVNRLSTANILMAIPMEWLSFLPLKVFFVINRACNCILAITSVKSNLPVVVQSFHTKLIRTLLTCSIPLLICLAPMGTVRRGMEISGALFINNLFILTPAVMAIRHPKTGYKICGYFVVLLSFIIQLGLLVAYIWQE